MKRRLFAVLLAGACTAGTMGAQEWPHPEPWPAAPAIDSPPPETGLGRCGLFILVEPARSTASTAGNLRYGWARSRCHWPTGHAGAPWRLAIGVWRPLRGETNGGIVARRSAHLGVRSHGLCL